MMSAAQFVPIPYRYRYHYDTNAFKTSLEDFDIHSFTASCKAAKLQGTLTLLVEASLKDIPIFGLFDVTWYLFQWLKSGL